MFFLNQQFITQGARADRGSYFVTTYKTTKQHDIEKKRNKKKREELEEKSKREMKSTMVKF